jgi:predicted dehydrogenase
MRPHHAASQNDPGCRRLVVVSAALRVAVIGAGRMGAHHARILSGLDGVRLAGVEDRHPERAAALAEQHGAPVFADLDAVIAGCDAAIVASSSPSHREVGRALLEAGIPCLIEKPLALSEADCLDLIASAARRGVVLAVGHVERFNPATVVLLETVAGWRLRTIETRRFNPAAGRLADTSVVSDLMVHDLDIVLGLIAAEPDAIVASGTVRDPAVGADHAMATLTFAHGAIAACAASRITPTRVRELVVTGDRGSATVDYLARSVTVSPPGGAPQPVPVPQHDALTAELAGFRDSVRAGALDPARCVDGAAALAALRVAWSIERQIAAP